MTYDRWNPPRETVVTEKPVKVFVPGDDPGARNLLLEVFGGRDVNAQHRVTEKPGFLIRERGALDGTVVHAYRCPVHGLFDARVSRSEVPDEMPCAHRDLEQVSAGGITQGRPVFCGQSSPWAGSFCGQGKAAGEVCS